MSEPESTAWYEIVSLREDGGEMLSDKDPNVFVRGKIGEITVVQVDFSDVLSAEDQHAVLLSISTMLDDAKISQAVIMPNTIKFMRLRRVGEEQSKRLDAHAGDDCVVTITGTVH